MWCSSELLQWTSKDRETILREYNRTPDSVRDDIELIKVWYREQKHLPEILNDHSIERFLCINKFRFEKTKQCIDMYYTIRNIIPELADESNGIFSENAKNSWSIYYSFPLPILFNNNRLTIFKLIDTNADHFDSFQYLVRELYFGEIRMSEDYDVAQMAILDMEGYSLQHVLKFTPKVLKMISFVVENLFSNNIRGLHFINAPQVAEFIITIFKGYLAPKLLDRIHIHKNVESLQDCVPIKYLPIELGGSEFSLKELNAKWQKKLESHEPRFEHLRNLKTDETLRPGKLVNNYDSAFGFHGNFRKLNVD